MQKSLSLLFLFLILSPQARTAEDDLPADLAALEEYFTAIYWHAWDNCLRETAPMYDGHHLLRDVYLASFITEITDWDAQSPTVAGAKVLEPLDPNEHWRFELQKTGSQWRVSECWKYLGEERLSSLYIDEKFFGRMVLGSLEPFMDAELEKFYSGEKYPSSRALDYSPETAPAYETLIGEGLAGSGFHFEVAGNSYVACSLHQFGNQVPESMAHLEIDDPIRITGQKYAGDDIQVLTYESPQLSALPALKFLSAARPEIGDVIYLYDFNEVYLGTVIEFDADTRKGEIMMIKPYPAAGQSGSPVVLARTNSAVGVVLTATSGKAASQVGFELLAP